MPTIQKHTKECPVCLEEKELHRAGIDGGLESFKKNVCRDRACKGCWRTYISHQVAEQKRVIKCICSSYCNFVLYDDDVKRLSLPEDYEKYTALRSRDCTRRYRDLEYWATLPEDDDNGASTFIPSDPTAPRSRGGMFGDERKQEEILSAKFLLSSPDYGQCPNPKCHVLINRDRGCSKVTCVCGTEICWRCKGFWHSHTSCDSRSRTRARAPATRSRFESDLIESFGRGLQTTASGLRTSPSTGTLPTTSTSTTSSSSFSPFSSYARYFGGSGALFGLVTTSPSPFARASLYGTAHAQLSSSAQPGLGGFRSEAERVNDLSGLSSADSKLQWRLRTLHQEVSRIHLMSFDLQALQGCLFTIGAHFAQLARDHPHPRVMGDLCQLGTRLGNLCSPQIPVDNSAISHSCHVLAQQVYSYGAQVEKHVVADLSSLLLLLHKQLMHLFLYFQALPSAPSFADVGVTQMDTSDFD